MDNRKLIINCVKLPFGSTLGVAGFLLNLCVALSRECELIFVLKEIDSFQNSPARPSIEKMATEIYSFEEASVLSENWKDKCIEILPHHFQGSLFCDRSILICHDLHAFDIPWKYNDAIREEFRQNLITASAVVTEFPRTYYRVEEIAGITLKNLFMVESPLMMDTSIFSGKRSKKKNPQPENLTFIFPAQLQIHKNHESLIRALSSVKEKYNNVQIICPGSSFKKDYTEKLHELAREFGVENNITFPGRITDEELLDLYDTCDGVIIPSMAEGGAYVAFEGIAAGKPVAVNKIESSEMHLMAVGAEVIWFDSENVSDTENAIINLIQINGEDWYHRNSIARDRISQMTWDKVAAKIEILISWLNAERDRPTLEVNKDGWNIEYI